MNWHWNVTIWKLKQWQWQWQWHCGVSKWRNLSGKNELHRKSDKTEKSPSNSIWIELFVRTYFWNHFIENILSSTSRPLLFAVFFFFHGFVLGDIRHYLFLFFTFLRIPNACMVCVSECCLFNTLVRFLFFLSSNGNTHFYLSSIETYGFLTLF